MSNSLSKINLLIFTFLVALGCESSSDEDYSLLLEDGIYVEVYDSTFQAKGRYTKDNFIYTHGVDYQYDYYYQNQKGVKFKYVEKEKTSNMSFKEKAQSWDFVEFDSIEDATIDQYELSIDTTINHMLYNMPGYNQTVINYTYRQVNKESEVESTTGLVENRENVWLHPPRQGLFQILELNPFPFIQRPYEIGNTWNWSLRIGETWGDNRWVGYWNVLK